MTIDKEKLKALAERAVAGNPPGGDGNPFPALAVRAVDVLALLAEIERLESEAMHTAAGVQSDREQLGQLKVENEALRDGANFRAIQSLRSDCEALRKDAERYRGVRRVANRQGFTDEQFDQQTDTRIASFDAAMAKEASHG